MSAHTAQRKCLETSRSPGRRSCPPWEEMIPCQQPALIPLPHYRHPQLMALEMGPDWGIAQPCGHTLRLSRSHPLPATQQGTGAAAVPRAAAWRVAGPGFYIAGVRSRCTQDGARLGGSCTLHFGIEWLKVSANNMGQNLPVPHAPVNVGLMPAQHRALGPKQPRPPQLWPPT